MIKLKKILIATVVGLFSLAPAYSQKKAELITTRWADQPIVANGSLDDWQDSLTFYNEATRLSYGLSNDDKYIYLAIKSTAKEDLGRILVGGISFSVNIEDTKKDPPTIIFPILDRTPGKPRNVNEPREPEEIQNEILSRIKDIKVKGFKEIIDGGISLQNTWGIRAAAGFDKGNLVQEIIIPLSLLNLSLSQTSEVLYSIKINGLPAAPVNMSRQNQNIPRQRMGGMYRNQFPQYNTPMNRQKTSTEFFIRSSLALKP
jgi:hypothetical protein